MLNWLQILTFQVLMSSALTDLVGVTHPQIIPEGAPHSVPDTELLFSEEKKMVDGDPYSCYTLFDGISILDIEIM